MTQRILSLLSLIGALAVAPGVRATSLAQWDSYFVGTFSAFSTAGNEASHLNALIGLAPGHSEGFPFSGHYVRSSSLGGSLPAPGSQLPMESYAGGLSIDNVGYLLATDSADNDLFDVWSVWYVNGLASPAAFAGFSPHSVILFSSTSGDPPSSTLGNETGSWNEYQEFRTTDRSAGFVIGVPDGGRTISLLLASGLAALLLRRRIV